MKTTQKDYSSSDLKSAAKGAREHFILAGVFSAASNLLMLTPIIYMLQVYDRVISSGSYATLAMLTILMVALLSASGGFEWARSRMLIAASARLDQNLRPRATKISFRTALLTGGAVRNAGPVSDLQGLRQFLTGNGIFAFFDAPWCPLYIIIMYMFHPWFAIAAILSVIIMISLAFLNNRLTTTPLEKANESSSQATRRITGMLQNSEVVAAMGMEEGLREVHGKALDQSLVFQAKASMLASTIATLSKSFRMIMQSILLGMGALLALNQEISPGMMIAGSLLLGRALAPIDLLVGSWKGFAVARLQYTRLDKTFVSIGAEKKFMSLPKPEGKIAIENLILTPPQNKDKIILQIPNLVINPGEILGVIGPSASGKSSLARALLGIWPTVSGKVRLDGVDVSTWDRNELGPNLGYLPQSIELFEGSIADNISRFSGINSEGVVSAAKAAGVHDLILSLSDGYETIILGDGGALSGGQRQRIGLARALYGEPKLLILDEPNSNLDDQGEKALIAAMTAMASRGSTVIVISHRTSTLTCVDKILAIQNGRVSQFGTVSEVFEKLAAAKSVAVSEQK
jgi:ATP-binding cassette subfamily C protein EexD